MVAGMSRGAPGSPQAHWDTERDMALTLCLQTPTGLWNCRYLPSSPPGCPLAPCSKSPCFLPKSFPSPHFSFVDPRAATSARSTASLQSWLILPKSQPEFGLTAPTSLQTASHDPELPELPAPCCSSPHLAQSVPCARWLPASAKLLWKYLSKELLNLISRVSTE